MNTTTDNLVKAAINALNLLGKLKVKTEGVNPCILDTDEFSTVCQIRDNLEQIITAYEQEQSKPTQTDPTPEQIKEIEDFFDIKSTLQQPEVKPEGKTKEEKAIANTKDAVVFLLDNNCGDLVLSSPHRMYKNNKIYASDIMEEYASFKTAPLLKTAEYFRERHDETLEINQHLLKRIEELEADNAYMNKEINDFTELNDTYCPSGVRFDEYIVALKTRIENLEETLTELIQVKDWKDKYGKDEHYLKAQPIAWENARKVTRVNQTNK